jgi:hypothetical protein
MSYSRVGPREQGKRYSKGSRKPVKVRQAKVRSQYLKKKYKPLTGHSGGAVIFDINFSSLHPDNPRTDSPHRGMFIAEYFNRSSLFNLSNCLSDRYAINESPVIALLSALSRLNWTRVGHC